MDKKKIETLAAQIRLETLKVIHSRGFGHVGGSMDLADLMAVLYGEVMRFQATYPSQAEGPVSLPAWTDSTHLQNSMSYASMKRSFQSVMIGMDSAGWRLSHPAGRERRTTA